MAQTRRMPTRERSDRASARISNREIALRAATPRRNLPIGAARAPVAAIRARAPGDAPRGLGADVTGQLAAAAPAFGDVLLSVGTAVARSQAALDAGLLETAKKLSATKITVVTDVIQKLDDDGLPVGDDSELITADVALINFVAPTVHQWEHVALSMDLEVGEFDAEQGVRFSRTQASTASVPSKLGGFLGWFGLSLGNESRTTTSLSSGASTSDVEASWAQGQVRLDAQLSPRATGKFPVPATVTIGPSIYFAQGSVSEKKALNVVTERSMELVISVRKAGGAVNPNQSIVVEAPGYRLSFATGSGFTGSTTNTQGQVKVTLTREIPNERFLRLTGQSVTARMGQVSNSVVINL